jgi:hypothetical protein
LGRHTDPLTLAFVQKLKEKGESLGYKTAEEQPILNGLYYADLTWSLADDQPPLVTFEVETEESLRVFKNTAKYFDTLSQEVPKPYRHFMILMQGRLSEGTRKPIQRYINYYNVSLFEDVASDQETAKILFEELDRMKLSLRELVARYLSSGQIDETLQELRLGIQKGMPKFLEPKNIAITVGSETRPDPLRPFKFEVIAKTPVGEPTLLQRMHDSLKTGEPVKITKDDQIKIRIPGHEEGDVEAIQVKLETIKGDLVRLETSDYANFIELLLTPESDNDQFVVISNVKQNAPWKVTFKAHKKSNQMEFSVNFNFDEGDPYQFVYFVDFVEQAKKENLLIVRREADNKVLFEGPFSSEFEKPSEGWMRILRALAEIQLKTNVRLPLPKSISDEELKEINKIYQIITKGEIEVHVESLKVNFDKEQAQHILDLSKNPDVIENFQVRINDTAELLGRKISVGDAELTIPKVRVDLIKLQEGVEKGVGAILIEVSVLPDKLAKISYRKWLVNKP